MNNSPKTVCVVAKQTKPPSFVASMADADTASCRRARFPGGGPGGGVAASRSGCCARNGKEGAAAGSAKLEAGCSKAAGAISRYISTLRC